MSYQKETNKYWAKRYWDKDDVNREYGNSSSGGGGGSQAPNADASAYDGGDGGLTKVTVGGVDLVVCNGGKGGKCAVNGGILGAFGGDGGLTKVTVGGVDLVVCNGGKGGKCAVNGGILGAFGGDGGEGGTGTGRDIIDKGGNGNNGCRRPSQMEFMKPAKYTTYAFISIF